MLSDVIAGSKRVTLITPEKEFFTSEHQDNNRILEDCFFGSAEEGNSPDGPMGKDGFRDLWVGCPCFLRQRYS
ncbi:hypothetical protein CEXT_336181 [Caerostris extrusa]|uniref:Uncharacterized protein n=1 Tax=Caerostris extrusa TaxID=172846 RepID=A0AAV4Q3F3_CAEEX|nr:hypothetical protein CEXT_336181 [Caerostris extrusa]